ncbi:MULTISPECIES: hypothetical protein [unclassified Streptomyces]|uniref:hypothetical protein n=1 Tax=unclassified Streptomyces TaxID=2593676 RepID=UPI0035DED2C6
MRPSAARRRGEATRLLREAERRTTPVEPPSSTWPDLDPADAYAIQQDNVARRLAAGSTVIGHKVGFTSAPMRELPGVSDPDFGHLLDDMVQRDGGDGTRRPFA